MSKLQSYWVRRITEEENHIKQREILLAKGIRAAEAELQKEYLAAANSLLRDIELAYQKFLLDPTSNNIYTFNRYYELLNDLNEQLTSLSQKEISLLSTKFVEMYEKSSTLVGKEIGFSNAINTQAAMEVVNRVWVNDGLNWSDRIWKHKDLLVESLRQTIVEAAGAGRSADELTKQLMSKMSIGFNEANRLARTELAHIQTQATLDTYKAAGVEQFEWMTASNCCDDCQALDKQRFNVDDFGHMPPLHPNCLCTIVAVVD